MNEPFATNGAESLALHRNLQALILLTINYTAQETGGIYQSAANNLRPVCEKHNPAETWREVRELCVCVAVKVSCQIWTERTENVSNSLFPLSTPS